MMHGAANWLGSASFIFTVLIGCSLCFMLLNFLQVLILRIVSARYAGRLPPPSAIRGISVIVPAYNEEDNIVSKIASILHAAQRVDVECEVIIGSDGSTDGTVEISRAYLDRVGASSCRVIAFENEGKCSTINKLVGEAKGEIVVSTDADIEVPVDALRQIVEAFRADKELGCVSCAPLFTSKNGDSQKRYWALEHKIREAESALGKLIVVTGWLFAFRKELYEKIPPGVMADDLWIPLSVLLKNFRCAAIPALRVLPEVTDEATETARRRRVMVGGMDVVRRLWPRLVKNPPILFLVLAHKVNRWALPVWGALFVVASIGIMPVAVVFYAVMGGVLMLCVGSDRCLTLGYAAVSPMLSFWEVMRKNDFSRWEHTRKN